MTLEESSPAVLRLFGREPLVEDWRCVGRWAYAACWLAEDRVTARAMVRARLAGAASLSVRAAMTAGRGDAERFSVVSALARIPDTIESERGPLVGATERAIDTMAADLLEDGVTLRALTFRERSAFVPRFPLESFSAAMLDVGPDRNVLLREGAALLDEALMMVTAECPALRALRLFLKATLCLDAKEASAGLEALPREGEAGAVALLSHWLNADLALAARRSAAFEAAWAAAVRVSGDALSRTIAGLTSGAMLSNGVAEALADDPWALLTSLAMTSEPEHASAILDCATQAQLVARLRAGHALERWKKRSQLVESLESQAEITITASPEAREGHGDFGACGGLDLFTAWSVVGAAEEGEACLRAAADESVSAERIRRRQTVAQAERDLHTVREAYEAAVESAQARSDAPHEGAASLVEAEEGAQRGCVYGFGAGCSVMATYVAVGLIVGTAGVVGKIAPLVVVIAAMPVLAAITVQIAVSIRRGLHASETTRRKSAASVELARAKAAAEKAYGSAIREGREALESAEASLASLERCLAQSAQIGA